MIRVYIIDQDIMNKTYYDFKILVKYISSA